MAKLLLSMVGAFAQFERSMIKRRQAEGLALAKARSVYKGRQRSGTDVNFQTFPTLNVWKALKNNKRLKI